MNSNLIINVFNRTSWLGTVERDKLLEASAAHFKSTSIYEPATHNGTSSMFFKVDEETDLLDLVTNLNRKDICINFIGDALEETKRCAHHLLVLYGLLSAHGKITHTDFTHKGSTEIRTREVILRSKTVIGQSVTDYTTPKDLASDRFEFQHWLTKAGIIDLIEKDSFVKLDMDSSEQMIYVENTKDIILMDNGQDGDFTSWLNQLSATFRHVKVRTQLTGKDLEFVRFTPEEDTSMRLTQGNILTSHFGLSSGKLIAEGYIEFDPTIIDSDGDPGGYVLTEKAITYRNNNTSRISSRKGVAVGDILINITNGLYYKVMGFNFNTGLYALMCEDMSHFDLNILFDNLFYQVRFDEKALAEEKLA